MFTDAKDTVKAAMGTGKKKKNASKGQERAEEGQTCSEGRDQEKGGAAKGKKKR